MKSKEKKKIFEGKSNMLTMVLNQWLSLQAPLGKIKKKPRVLLVEDWIWEAMHGGRNQGSFIG